MKLIIIFALLAFVTCEESILDVVSGFTSQLGLSDAQAESANTCLFTLVGELQRAEPAIKDLEHGDIQDAIVDGTTVAENFESDVEAACNPFLQALNNYVITNGNGKSGERNAEDDGAYIAQQLAILVQNAAQQNLSGVGHDLGYIFQISAGAVDLPSLNEHVITTYEQYQTYSQNSQSLFSNSDSLTEYLQAYVNELGVQAEVNVSAIVQLIEQAQGVAAAVLTLENEEKGGDWDSDIDNLENFVHTVLEYVKNNRGGLEAIAAADAPLYQAVEEYGLLAVVGQVVFNTFLNAPEVEHLQQQVEKDILNGDYNAAGTDAGLLAKAYYGNIYAN